MSVRLPVLLSFLVLAGCSRSGDDPPPQDLLIDRWHQLGGQVVTEYNGTGQVQSTTELASSNDLFLDITTTELTTYLGTSAGGHQPYTRTGNVLHVSVRFSNSIADLTIADLTTHRLVLTRPGLAGASPNYPDLITATHTR